MKRVRKEYKDKRWKRKRQVILRRDGYRCRECARYGRATPAVVVHHIIPLNDYPELWLDSNNLISLCNACHEKMHDRNSDQLTVEGEALRKRVERRTNHSKTGYKQ